VIGFAGYCALTLWMVLEHFPPSHWMLAVGAALYFLWHVYPRTTKLE
jgi:hypothetical protein